MHRNVFLKGIIKKMDVVSRLNHKITYKRYDKDKFNRKLVR